jgi:hypothetical protein
LQGEVPTKDLITGSIILAVFLICVYFAGRILSRFKNARYARVWEPLRPIIDGVVVDDGGGAATSCLTGTYKGRGVRASMVPGRNRYPDETGFRYNYFDAALLEVPGKSDWTLKDSPHSKDKSLEQRLRDSPAVAILKAVGPAEVIYDSRQQKLTIIQEPGSGWIPSAAQFEIQLNTLLRLAEINAAVN